jgi:leader peptidase (prepilin peptidase) / N-methyltransferase
MTTIVAVVIGLAWGLAADRIAARWPVHEDGSIRPIDWRTPVVALVGGAAAGLLIVRYSADLTSLVVIGVVVVGLILLFATDLDQRLLPDVLTLPLIPYALGLWLLAANPYVHGPSALIIAAVAALILPLGMYLLSLPFGPGAIGAGDLKLLVGVGLLGGAWRLLAGLVVGAIAAAFVIIVLVVFRQITLRSYVPYGPFLILGCLWALLVLSDIAPT